MVLVPHARYETRWIRATTPNYFKHFLWIGNNVYNGTRITLIAHVGHSHTVTKIVMPSLHLGLKFKGLCNRRRDIGEKGKNTTHIGQRLYFLQLGTAVMVLVVGAYSLVIVDVDGMVECHFANTRTRIPPCAADTAETLLSNSTTNTAA